MECGGEERLGLALEAVEIALDEELQQVREVARYPALPALLQQRRVRLAQLHPRHRHRRQPQPPHQRLELVAAEECGEEGARVHEVMLP